MKKLGMKLFIASDALTFAALLVVYGFLRSDSPEWPRPFTIVPGVVMTAVLLGSSLTMMLAVKAMPDHGRALRWLLATMVGGVVFIVMHLSEWRHSALESGVFGLHMAHVAAGLVYLAVLAAGLARGRFSGEDVETGGLYWQFVDVVWLFVFPLVYLTAVKP